MRFVENLLRTFSYVHIAEEKRNEVEEILQTLIKDGRNLLHVVADFDFTLTIYEKNGQILPSSHGVIENDDRVTLPSGALVRIEAEQLRTKYRAIEHDPQLTVEEKIPLMIEWWQKAHSLLIASNLNKSIIRQLVEQSALELKDGVREFISELLHHQIPLLIFSAGLGDVIDVFLKKEIAEFDQYSSSHIVSNFMRFNQFGTLIGFNSKLIHSFNKNEQEIEDTSYCQSIVDRPNVILLGDTQGDVEMINGIKNLQKSLKIGYLNHSTPNKLSIYQSIYHIVICDNQTFDVPNLILKAI